MENKQIPQIGFGTWKLPQENCANLVYEAIKIGYRHIDCACDYGNEIEVGLGIKKALDENICSRQDLWITSKLWNTYHSKEHVELALQKTLQDLNIDYLDLYLIHFPISLKFVPFEKKYPPGWVIDSNSMELSSIPLHQTWEVMEELVDKKLVNHIGICNYNSGLLHDLMNYSRIKPFNLQIESHPYLTQENIIKTAKNYGLNVTAYSPLGPLSYVELDMDGGVKSLIETDLIQGLCKKYQKTPAQILLRWGIDRETIIIPKTSNIVRMKENFEIFNFDLEKDDIEEISNLNCNKRFNNPAIFCEKAFGLFHTIYD